MIAPYYQRGPVTLYHGPAEVIAPQLHRRGIVLCDPPYSAHVHEKSRAGARDVPLRDGNGRMSPSAIYREVDFGFSHLTPELRRFLAEQAARIASRWALIFCDAEGLGAWRDDLNAAGITYRTHCLWRKVCATPKFTGMESAIPDETIAVAANDAEAFQGHIAVAHREPSDLTPRRYWNAGGKLGYYECRVATEGPGRHDARINETQKPFDLIAQLILDWTDPGEHVIDLTAGGCTTLVAAALLGRTAVGIEQREEQCELAAKRLEAELSGFGGAVGKGSKQTSIFELMRRAAA